MEKTTIKIRYKWEFFLGLIVALFALLALLLEISFWKNGMNWERIVGVVGTSLFLIAGIIVTMVSSQTAEISEKGIVFKNILRKPQFLSWQEITKIQIEDVKSLSIQGIIHETKWICIHYNAPKGCRYICPTDKNISVLRYYIQKYAFTEDSDRNDLLDLW